MKISALLILIVTGLMVGCNDQADLDDQGTHFELNTIKDGTAYQSALEALDEGTKSDLFKINSVVIDDNTLKLLINVSYGGGCKKHVFDLIWPDAIIAIYPPQFGLILNHNANEDMCEAYLTQTLEIDLKNNPLNLDDQSIKDMTVTVINGSNPDEKVQSE